MKHIFTKLLLGVAPLTLLGQTMVSTTPENKKVILEEFTGIYCVYCPSGHQIAKQIQDNNPGNVFLINIHQGGYATPQGSAPDFRTSFGNAIANQSGLTGYPSGTVNRHVFPGLGMSSNSTAMGRDKWMNAANQVLAMPSYVNVALTSTVDVPTRQMTINVEVYYTGNSPQSTNKLNVALLQNNTKGPQTGGNQGNNYNHMHRLIHMITGQWGEEITTTTSGSFVSKSYTYTIPESHNNIPIVLGELELVAFIAEGNQEIISGNGTFPAYTNLPVNNEIGIVKTYEIKPTCEGSVTPKIQIKNNGNNVLTSLDISYTLNNGTAQTYTWTGNLGGLQTADVELPELEFTAAENVISISIPSDEDNANNTATIEFDKAPESNGVLKLEIRTDAYGGETSWNIKNSAGQIVKQGGGYGNNQTINVDLDLTTADCYTFTINDSFGDGGARATLKDENNQVLFNILGTSYTSTASSQFSSDGSMGVADLTKSGFQIYPNPSTGIVNVDLKKASTIEVFDVTGKLVQKVKGNIGTNTVDLTGKGKGVFVVKVQDGSETTTKKVVIK